MGRLGIVLVVLLVTLNIAFGVVIEETHQYLRKENHVQPGSLAHLAKLSESNWPELGPWIVHVDFDSFDNVLDHLKSVVDAQIHDSWSAKDGLTAIAVEGIKKSDIQGIAGVSRVAPDKVFTAAAFTWGQDRIDQRTLPLSKTYAPGYRGCGVDVYIVDTGIDTLHSEFSDNGFVYGNGQKREVRNIYNHYGDVTDNTDANTVSHGTHCAGTVGGINIGVAPCANLYGVKILSDEGYGSTRAIVRSLEFIKARHIAKTNAKTIVSMSLGGHCSGGCSEDALVRKVEELTKVGIISAVAAGNDNINAANVAPAAAPNAVTVGASTSSDAKASFSNFGKVLDVFAPGQGVLSACSSRTPGCTGYFTLSGTSMATPHVAGALAQYLETSLPMKTATAVTKLRNRLVNDAVNAVQGANDATTKKLLQTPTAPAGISICFRDTSDGVESGGSLVGCSGFSSKPYRTGIFHDLSSDNPDNIKFSWTLVGNTTALIGHEFRLCAHELTGNAQCGGSTAPRCTAWVAAGSPRRFTPAIAVTAGGCQYAWSTAHRRMSGSATITSGCRLWFQETEGGAQCLGERGPSSSSWTSAAQPAYTAPFTLATTSAPGGCSMQWGLQCN